MRERHESYVEYIGQGTAGSTLVMDRHSVAPSAPEGLPLLNLNIAPEPFTICKTLHVLYGGDPARAHGVARLLMDPIRERGYWRFDRSYELVGYSNFWHAVSLEMQRTACLFHRGFNESGSVLPMECNGDLTSSEMTAVSKACTHLYSDGGVEFIPASERSLVEPAEMIQSSLRKVFAGIVCNDLAVVFVPAWVALLAGWSCQKFLEMNSRVIRPFDGFEIQLCRRKNSEEVFYRRSKRLLFGTHHRTLLEKN